MSNNKTIVIEKNTSDRLFCLRKHINTKGIKGIRIAEDTLINYLLDYYYDKEL